MLIDPQDVEALMDQMSHYEAVELLIQIRARSPLLETVATTARHYRSAECEETPRMWRGKRLQDLANLLDNALDALDPEDSNTGEL
jgi:signal transduction histidine kinase